jgi:hypothetical protein
MKISKNSEIETFKTPRCCNLILLSDNLQGDGFISLIITVFHRAIKFKYWFYDNKELMPQFDWRVCR